jgi:hypothetical protein
MIEKMLMGKKRDLGKYGDTLVDPCRTTTVFVT